MKYKAVNAMLERATARAGAASRARDIHLGHPGGGKASRYACTVAMTFAPRPPNYLTPHYSRLPISSTPIYRASRYHRARSRSIGANVIAIRDRRAPSFGRRARETVDGNAMIKGRWWPVPNIYMQIHFDVFDRPGG